MPRSERIIMLLTEALQPTVLKLLDDSHKHAGHAGAAIGGETHYALTIETEAFQGLSRVQCHQLIYKLLEKELKTGLHALSIKASAPSKS